ncbi:glycosyltransferase family 87 protein [Sediminibacterium soli]|uniref:glycosyltransferase family 87 protein n=1 Tax=Sediminibacterium soli TaxID=2698829 RepID=UPI00137AF3D1|nr:glycosyltransferase family 87 protein [Sediminibacterium soli]NCI47325.1 DUF2029 domain-containing protein [Sediminibacterium soli]
MNVFLRSIRIGKWQVPFPVFLWFTLAVVAVSLELSRGEEHFNNFLLYRHVFLHTLDQVNLYKGEPFHLFDNHYGPFFSIIIAPFSFFGNYAGCFLWCVANAWILYYAISRLALTQNQKLMILLVSALEMMTAIHSVQFNPMLAGWIIMAYVLTEKEKDFWATLFIVAGFLVKLYGIVGIVFFFFSKHKPKFVWSFFFWLIVLFCLPMLISSPAFVVQSYGDWYESLRTKDALNTDGAASGFMQDISVMGMIRRIGGIDISNTLVILPAALVYAFPLVRVKQFFQPGFRLAYLALALIGIVIFSSSAESPTYVIAMVGASIWYVIQPDANKKWAGALLLFAFILTSLSPTDLFPRYLREQYVRPYSLKALPCFIIWLVIAVQLIRHTVGFRKERALYKA